MNRSFQNSMGLSFLLAIGSAGDVLNPSVYGAKRKLKVIVRVYDDAQVSPRTLAAAEEEAAKVLRKAGVETEWLDCSSALAKLPACDRPPGPMDLILRIVPRSRADRLGFADDTVGFALATEGGGGVEASVFYHAVERLARFRDASKAQILGHLSAHEIGHLLLGSRVHSPAGIMRSKWAQKDLQCAARGDLDFTPQQSELLRAALLRRSLQRSTDAPAAHVSLR